MERYIGYGPCPCCFESSGYMGQIVSATWTDPSYEDVDYSRRCPECDGTGMVESDEARTLDDLVDEADEIGLAVDAGFARMAAEHAAGCVGDTPVQLERVA